MNTDQLDRLKVNEVFNESINRPFLFVYPQTILLELATFLAIGPEIYVDGLVVVTELKKDGKKIQTPIGRIGGRNVLSSILDGDFNHLEDFFLHMTASQIMVEMTDSDWVELKSPLSKVIDIFKRTRFAFVPIVGTSGEDNNNKPTTVGSLTIRDFLPLIVNKKICVDLDDNNKVAIDQISSPLIFVNKNTTIRNAISIMMNKGIRNIGVENRNHDCMHGTNEGNGKVKRSKSLSIVNDRKIMEFLLSRKMRKIVNMSLGAVSDLDIVQIQEVRNDITVKEAAQYLMNVRNPALGRKRFHHHSMGSCYENYWKIKLMRDSTFSW
jgi:CBS domain-containing protein